MPKSIESLSLPQLTALYGALNKSMVTCERNRLKYEAGGSLSKCEVCKAKKEIKRCTGCYMVWYCGQECQTKGWEDHKVECKKTRKEYTVIRLTQMKLPPGQVGVSICRLNGNVYGDGEYRKLKKTHFVVKVQIPLDNAAFPLFIYNEDRSISGELCKEGNEEIHGELSRQIRSVGIGKGYFRAFLDKEKQLKINPLRSQPPESW